jgi:hypothetical protein
MNTLQLAQLKQLLLQEIGDATAKDLPKMNRSHTQSIFGDTVKYSFDLEGLEYQISLTKEPATGTGENDDDADYDFRIAYEVGFGVTQGIEGTINYNKEVNSPKTVFKVMTSVVKSIAKEAIKDQENGARLSQIIFAPVKQEADDNRRENLYFLYIKKLLGDEVKISIDKEAEKDGIIKYIVDIPDDYEFETVLGTKRNNE